MNKLNNKVIIVTGGNGLLGKDIINKIRSEGARCINLDINHETDLDQYNIKCDITCPNSVTESIELIIDKFENIDGLVNNAYPRTKDWGKKFEDINYESWKNNIDWQMNSYFFVTQQVALHMKKRNYGSIVNIASIYGSVGPDFNIYEGTEMTMPAAYSAIKGGIINLTRYLCSYLGEYQIRVNCISPGGVFDNQNNLFVNNYRKKVPLRRMCMPSDISPAVCFMLSDEASYISGQNLLIDGGWTSI